MSQGIYHVPTPLNEPVLSYAPGSPEKSKLKSTLKRLGSEAMEIPLIIGGREVWTKNFGTVVQPHRHGHTLAKFCKAGEKELQMAITASREAWHQWSRVPWSDRAAIFLKMAELLAGPHRMLANASTMLGQSKSAHQAEIDSACEMIDFLRFNVHFLREILSQQPISAPGVWNRMDYRALEGFIVAISPFNFTSIGGNLPTAPALMGNTVLWKPASTGIFSAWHYMKLFQEAGLPDGVINFVPGDGSTLGKVAFSDPGFAGLHFTGSTEVFNSMWRTVGENLGRYKNYPRLVGETGGKDFVFAHPSADPLALTTALVRGAFEYQGQKCSAASRAYIPKSLWKTIKKPLADQIESIKMGDVEDFTHFMNAVIDRASFQKCQLYIENAKKSRTAKILVGGECDDKIGFFVRPTVIVADDPGYASMVEEIFGPILTLHPYDDDRFVETLKLCDQTSPYSLTGAIFARDRYAILQAEEFLFHSAGNYYINDKPTGAVVGQQPFGGARSSGTNDKAGSHLNLLRWCSARTIKETFVPPTTYPYSFMSEK